MESFPTKPPNPTTDLGLLYKDLNLKVQSQMEKFLRHQHLLL